MVPSPPTATMMSKFLFAASSAISEAWPMYSVNAKFALNFCRSRFASINPGILSLSFPPDIGLMINNIFDFNKAFPVNELTK
ncbi:hypothetical protein D3C86_1807980 [compost metagenome]